MPDGISVVMASRILGAPIPERVTGGDLMERLCAEAAHVAARPTMREWLSRTARRDADVSPAEVLDELDEQRGDWPDAGR